MPGTVISGRRSYNIAGGKHTLRYETPYVVRDPGGRVYVVGRIHGIEVFRIGVVSLFSSRVAKEFPD